MDGVALASVPPISTAGPPGSADSSHRSDPVDTALAAGRSGELRGGWSAGCAPPPSPRRRCGGSRGCPGPTPMAACRCRSPAGSPGTAEPRRRRGRRRRVGIFSRRTRPVGWSATFSHPSSARSSPQAEPWVPLTLHRRIVRCEQRLQREVGEHAVGEADRHRSGPRAGRCRPPGRRSDPTGSCAARGRGPRACGRR